ncbi:hypothetical protein AB0I61_17155 [Polymorphospora rubra]|uniref:hypothetical protein n=1 Tax=Polymorphospora rubra TaxID=338584 RepID=UPI0034100B0D
MSDADRYRIEFTRIGRNRNVPALETEPIDGPNHLAEVIYQYARRHLGSRGVEVDVDLEAGTGQIFCGFHSGGTFTISPIDGGAR